MKEILDYFPDLSEKQIQQFEQLYPLYKDWNDKINVISRKDIDNLYLHHVLHSLAIAKNVEFIKNAEILDLGTGGGFPGIPLAILFPETRFTLIDGTRKKLRVVEAVKQDLELDNVIILHRRAEEIKHHFDFVVTRAVARLEKLFGWSQRLLKRKEQHAIPNGLLALKGGHIQDEIKELPRGSYTEITNLARVFEEPYFEEKCLVYVQA